VWDTAEPQGLNVLFYRHEQGLAEKEGGTDEKAFIQSGEIATLAFADI